MAIPRPMVFPLILAAIAALAAPAAGILLPTSQTRPLDSSDSEATAEQKHQPEKSSAVLAPDAPGHEASAKAAPGKESSLQEADAAAGAGACDTHARTSVVVEKASASSSAATSASSMSTMTSYFGSAAQSLQARVSNIIYEAGEGVKREAYGLPWLMGVSGMVFGGTLASVGFLVQKGAHLVHQQQLESEAAANRSSRLRRRASAPVGAYWKQRRWVLGLIPVILGFLSCWIGQILAPGWAPLCINAWITAFTVLAAPFCPGEHVSNSTRVGAMLMVLGCSWMLHSGPVDLQGGPVLYEAYAASATLAALILVATVLSLIMLVSHTRKRKPGSNTLNAFESGVVAAIFAWCTWTLSRNCDAVLASTRSTDLQSLLFWLLALGGTVGFMLSVHFFNLALQSGDVSVAVPSFMGTSLLGGPMFSMILLVLGRRHGLVLEPHTPALFGIALVSAGVVFLGCSASFGDEIAADPTSKLKQRRVAKAGLFPDPDLIFEAREASHGEEERNVPRKDQSPRHVKPPAPIFGAGPQPGWGSGLFEGVEPAPKPAASA